MFTADRPNACWLSDITYIPTREGWLYLAAVLDVYSRTVIGWAMSRTLDCQLARDALSMAIGRRGPPAILHSDQGTTYSAADYRKLLDYRTRDQARASLSDYMEVFYNRQRRHSTLNYETSLAFEAVQIA